jgi:hypothetical protein
MRRLTLAMMIAAALVGNGRTAAGQDVLGAARARYVEADYEGTLALLARASAAPGDEPGFDEQHLRVLSLLALGRAEEAERQIARLVAAHPSYTPGDDHSPRVRLAFRSVRDRVLPVRARALYEEGRRAYGDGRFQDAAGALAGAMPIIDALVEEGRAGMADLRVLAAGFLALARERMPADPPSTPLPTGRSMDLAARLSPLVAADRVSTPPVPIDQALPPWPFGLANMRTTFRGAIDVRIDERGLVASASMATPVHPVYDRQLLLAAQQWRYEPARRGGQPVPSLKRVEVVIQPR